ncbi:hypothetical protein X777_16998, partial [Ooceraea biroi]
PVERIDLDVICGFRYQATVSLRQYSPTGYVLAGTLLIPLYPGASSHDVAKRHSLAVKG